RLAGRLGHLAAVGVRRSRTTRGGSGVVVGVGLEGFTFGDALAQPDDTGDRRNRAVGGLLVHHQVVRTGRSNVAAGRSRGGQGVAGPGEGQGQDAGVAVVHVLGRRGPDGEDRVHVVSLGNVEGEGLAVVNAGLDVLDARPHLVTVEQVRRAPDFEARVVVVGRERTALVGVG